jgi:hypothetical protein
MKAVIPGGVRMRIPMMFMVLALSMAGLALAGDAPAVADQLLGQYFSIQKSLASDSISGVASAAAELVKISRQAGASQHEGQVQLAAFADLAAKFNAADLKAARNGFGDLSDRLIAFLKASKAKTNPPFQFYCSMVKKNWLQADKATRNPYYGSSMLTCGELVK